MVINHFTYLFDWWGVVSYQQDNLPRSCPRWASASYCQRTFATWMTANCPKSCNKCPCKDQFRLIFIFVLFMVRWCLLTCAPISGLPYIMYHGMFRSEAPLLTCLSCVYLFMVLTNHAVIVTEGPFWTDSLHHKIECRSHGDRKNEEKNKINWILKLETVL